MAEIDTLIECAKAGDLRQVRKLLSGNFMLASQRLESGETPLMSALYRGHHDVVAALIDAGAEVDVFAAAALGRGEDLSRTLNEETVAAYAYDGWTPLHLAAFFGQLEAARALLARGADVHAVSRNSMANTPLHAATAGRHPEIALLLLDHGASGSALDAGGYTPREIASQNGLDEVVARIGS